MSKKCKRGQDYPYEYRFNYTFKYDSTKLLSVSSIQTEGTNELHLIPTSKSNISIDYAEVTLKNLKTKESISTYFDKRNKRIFANIPEGRYQLSIKQGVFKPFVDTFRITSNNIKTLKVQFGREVKLRVYVIHSRRRLNQKKLNKIIELHFEEFIKPTDNSDFFIKNYSEEYYFMIEI